MPFTAIRRRSYFADRRTTVVVSRHVTQEPMRQHLHEFLEIAIILSGEGVHVTGSLRHRIEAGDVLVISRRRPHGYERTCGLHLINLLVREDALPRLARELRFLSGFHALFALESLRWSRENYASRLHLAPADLAQVGEWANRLEEEAGRPDQGGRVLAEAYLVLIMGLLAQRYSRPRRLAAMPEGGMGRVLSWIESHLAEPLSVAQMAAQAGMSARSFHRHFRQATGRTPLQYLLRQRIARARDHLLAHPGDRMSEVATRCGFEDSNYFSRVFHARTGTAPRRFSRLRRAGRS
jgi:AraC-like DNA-binding protein